jgi:hypothetical protein
MRRIPFGRLDRSAQVLRYVLDCMVDPVLRCERLQGPEVRLCASVGPVLTCFRDRNITTQIPQSIYIVRVVMATCLGRFVAGAMISQDERTRKGEMIVVLARQEVAR